MVIQTTYRRHTAQRSFRRAVAAAVRIQAATRTRIARRAYRHDLARWVRVQAFRRGYSARTAALAQRRDESARKVQRAVREWLIVRTFFQGFDGGPALGSTLLVGSPGLPSGYPSPGLRGTVWAEWLRTLTPREEPAGPAPAALPSSPAKLESPVKLEAPAASVSRGREKENVPLERHEKPAGEPAKDTLRGRRVLALQGNMCTLSLLEQAGAVRVEAAMRKGGKLLRGSAAVPDPTQDAWAVWARTEVEVEDTGLRVEYR